jgi:hypothetical protein
MSDDDRVLEASAIMLRGNVVTHSRHADTSKPGSEGWSWSHLGDLGGLLVEGGH